MINTVIAKMILKDGAYILAVVILPLIVLGFCILRKGKYKKVTITILSVLTVLIYAISAKSLVESASRIVSICDFTSEIKDVGTDITFLKNYEQKAGRDGYISKDDVNTILNIADSKSKEIFINYKDESSNINISATNKNDDEIANLKDLLETNYYKFNYSTDEKIIINIERYVVEEKKSEEKNNSIIITGNKNADIIKKVDKSYISDDSTYFSLENQVNVIKGQTDTSSTNGFKILLAYDPNVQNYVPVASDLQYYKYIESYKIYSRGIEIELKNGVHLDDKDYTLRINRYNDNLEVIERTNSNINTWYYYEYEPVVTETTNNERNVILNIEFDRSYSINELKNVEVIFGK